MSIPREMSRDTSEGLLISKYPDVCKAPIAPCPFTIVAKQSDDAGTAATVRATGKRVHKQSSIITKSSGDEPGTGLGVKSGTVGSVCHRKTHSSSVRIEGEWATRHGDIWYMNNKNCEGKLVYVKNTQVDQLTPPIYFADEDDSLFIPLPKGIKSFGNFPDPNPTSTGEEIKLAFEGDINRFLPPSEAPPKTQPEVKPKKVPKVANNDKVGKPQNSRWWTKSVIPLATQAGTIVAKRLALAGVILVATTTEVAYSEIPPWEKDANNPDLVPELQPLIEKAKQRAAAGEDIMDLDEWYREEKVKLGEVPATGVSKENNRVSQREEEDEDKDPCITGPYSKIKKLCSVAGKQAHHIVPDYTLRYGNRADGMKGKKRIPGLPSFKDGPAICLKGYAKSAGSEHSIAHGADIEIAEEGGLRGMAPINRITKISEKYANKATKDECIKEIKAALATQPLLFSSIIARTTINPPPSGTWPP